MSNLVMKPPMTADAKAGYEVGKAIGRQMYTDGKSEEEAKSPAAREAPEKTNRTEWQKGYNLGQWAGWRSEYHAQQSLPQFARMANPPASLPRPQTLSKQHTAASPGGTSSGPPSRSNTLLLDQAPQTQRGVRPREASPPAPAPGRRHPSPPAPGSKVSPPTSSRSLSPGKGTASPPVPRRPSRSATHPPPLHTNLPLRPQRSNSSISSTASVNESFSPVSPPKATATTAVSTAGARSVSHSPPRRALSRVQLTQQPQSSASGVVPLQEQYRRMQVQ